MSAIDATDLSRRSTDPSAVSQTTLMGSVADQLVADILKERKAERRWKVVRRAIWIGMVLLGLVYYIAFVVTAWGYRMIPNTDLVAVIHLKGAIGSDGLASAEKVIPALKRAFERPNVKAIAIAIDSPGGAPVESERINNAIDSLRAKYPKPVLAFVNNLGASAAYMVAIKADTIYAANYSLVGSIGAIMSGWDFHKALDKLSVSQRVYASGSLKGMLNPYVETSPDADAKAKDIVTKMGERFRDDVVAARGTKLLKGVDIATGEVWNGFEAKRIGLVDEIGTLDDVVESKFKLKTFDFGPGRPGLPLISAAFEDIGRGLAQAVMNNSISIQ
jgi:protease IV